MTPGSGVPLAVPAAWPEGSASGLRGRQMRVPSVGEGLTFPATPSTGGRV